MAGGLTSPAAQNGSRHRARMAVAAAALLYLAAVIMLALGLSGLGDRWWPATLVLYGPRWIAALPLAILVPAALARKRVALVPVAGAAALMIGPILGLELPLAHLAEGERAGHLRVVTFNAGSRELTRRPLLRLLDEQRPDLVAMQECPWTEAALAAAFPGWEARSDKGQCLLSRHPVIQVEPRDRTDVWRRGGNGAIIRYTIDLARVQGAPARINLLHLHLETVRDAIEALLHGGPRGAPEHDRNVALRAWESEVARAWVDTSPHPTVVAGDLNLPVESAIYRRSWADLENAFSRAGVGFGATKRTRWFGLRIDHVLVGPGWSSERAWIGPDLGSDHRPLLADLRWAPRK